MTPTHAVSCPHCGKQFQVSASAAGKSAKCSGCNERFVVSLPLALSPAQADDYSLATCESCTVTWGTF